jgi:adenylate kinase family enzyme
VEIYKVVPNLKRIAVTGPAGAGKSQLAHELGAALAIRVLHLDTMFWKPGWVPTPDDEFEAMQRRELAADSWVVDAQFHDVLPDWFQTADAIVFIDASLLRCFWRVAHRRLNGGSVGTPAGTRPGALHRAIMKFARNQWRYRRRVRGELLAELARERDGRRVIVVRRDSDAAAFLRSLDSPTPAGGTL